MNSNSRHAGRHRSPRPLGRRLRVELLEDRVLLAADRFEPNDDMQTARDLGEFEQYHAGLTIDPAGDHDWYRWTPINNGQATADIRFQHAAGDLTLEVYDSGRGPSYVSDSVTDNESISWKTVAGQTYVLHVFGSGIKSSTTYAMYLDMPGQWIAPDSLEGRLRNNSFSTATDLGAEPSTHKSLTLDFDQIEGVVDDADVYRWTAPSGGTLTVDITFLHELGNVDMELYDGQQRLLASSTSLEDREHISWPVAGQQSYFVRVFGVRGVASPGYDLELGFQSGLVVTNASDRGPGSLRQAILDSNNRPGQDAITFRIDEGPQSIRLASALPVITDPVTIDATTQPGYEDAPLIQIDGQDAGAAAGLTVNADDVTIAGLVVSGFAGAGILVSGDGNTIRDNYIGTDFAGMKDRGNAGNGIEITNGAEKNAIWGNLISGNEESGVALIGVGADRNDLQSNLIGTDALGSRALGNRQHGIVIQGGLQNMIGGTDRGRGNVISGNGGDGVLIVGPDSTDVGNSVWGNFIGTDATGAALIANQGSGVSIMDSNNNSVGGTEPGAGNVIAGNQDTGVVLGDGVNNAIRRNSFLSNRRLGIDLMADGVTLNDRADADSGPNHLQNFPQVFAATLAAKQAIDVSYTVDSAPDNSAYPLEIEFYLAGPDGDEGATFIGSDTFSTKDYAAARKTLAISSPSIAVGERLVATATDAAGNTSEFSVGLPIADELPPFISDIPDQTTSEDVPTGAIPFTVDGPASESLTVSATSDNPNLVSPANIQIAGSGAQRSMVVRPTADQFGSATITLAVETSNGQSATAGFVLLVEPVNDAPVNSVPLAQIIDEDTKLEFSTAEANAITVRDVDAGNASVRTTLTVDQGTLTLGGTADLKVQGDGSSQVIMSGPLDAINKALEGMTYSPDANFYGTVTLSVVTDDQGHEGTGGALTDTDAVTIVVNDVDDALVISAIEDQQTTEGVAMAPVTFTVVDGGTPGASLVIKAESDNQRLVQNENITVTGQGTSWSVSVTPTPHQIGRAIITITADNAQGGTAERSFALAVRSLPDTDGDGLPDLWETVGLDVNGDGTVDLDLPGALGADPNHIDVFVEVDAMQGRGPYDLSEPVPEVPDPLATGTVLDHVIASFLNSPVENPDGTTGIRLHIQLDETEIPRQDFSLGWDEFDALKCGPDGDCDPASPSDGRFGTAQQRADANWDNISAAKSLVFRYGLFADRRGTDGMSGLAERPGNDFMVTLGDWITPDGHAGGTWQEQTGTFMHELGHTLSLRHGGGDEVNYKPNYFSVMNYHWQVPTPNTGWHLDYSRQQLPTLDETNLDEAAGMGFPAGSVHDVEDHVVHVGPSLQVRLPLVGPADLNVDGDTVDTGIALDLNNDALLQPLHGFDDWGNLRFTFRDLVSYDDGVHLCDDEDCDDVEEQTDFDPVNAYTVLEDQFEPNDTREEVAGLSDLGSEDTVVVATVHDSSNEDWYRWTAPIRGILELILEKDQDADLGLDLALHDAAGTLMAVATSALADDFEPAQIESEVDEGDAYFIKATSPGTGYYLLRVDDPEVWDGDANVGSPGDGTDWGNEHNWTIDGTSDARMPDETDHVTFDVTSVGRSVTLGNQSRFVKSLTFLDDYTLSEGTLDIASGIVSVASGSTATFDANLVVPEGVLKKDEGALLVRGQIGGSTEVLGGTLGGAGSLNNLLVASGAMVSPGESVGTLSVGGVMSLSGAMRVEVDGAGSDRMDVAGAVTLTGAALQIEAITRLPETGDTSRTIISAASIDGTFDSVPATGEHVGNGVFVGTFDGLDSPLRYDETGVELALFQAAAGDANGDREFSQVDIIQVLQGAKYLSGTPATWGQGDWDGNGLFNQVDVILALQAANYLQGPYASLRPAPDAGPQIDTGHPAFAASTRRPRDSVNRTYLAAPASGSRVNEERLTQPVARRHSVKHPIDVLPEPARIDDGASVPAVTAADTLNTRHAVFRTETELRGGWFRFLVEPGLRFAADGMPDDFGPRGPTP